MKHRHVETIVALTLLALITLAACVDAQDDQDLDLKHHCEMVGIYTQSNGEHGWPDYNNTAGDCPKEE